jgi:hypothetical protein
MSYSKKFEELRDAAKRKAEELDEQFRLREKLEQGITAASQAAEVAGKAVSEVVSKGAEAVSDATGDLRQQAQKAGEGFQVGETVRETADKAAEKMRTGAQVASETAREFFGQAEGFYRRAEQAYNAGASGARLTEATLSGYQKAREWVKENPGKTAVVTFSMIAGIRAGSALPDIGATILGAGAAHHWFFHSALPVVGLRKLTETYHEYLKEQEQRIANGGMDDAEKSRIEFQRDLTKYVGAPLLGAFSVAAGAGMIGAAVSGATVTGLPINLILGGNPLLNGIWFFANGVICISEGYKFFMIALADEEEVQRVVREIRGLLPAAAQ